MPIVFRSAGCSAARTALWRPMLPLVICVGGLLAGTPAQASCTALVHNPTCSATVSATPLMFGNYLAINRAPTSGNSIVSVTGTASGPSNQVSLGYTISLSSGNSGSASNRHLINGAARLSYNMYTSDNYGTVWGDNTVSDSMGLFGSASQTKNYTVYGRIPAAQFSAPAGNYHDLITVTVTY
ncbi:spore coat protein U domain-containing protein [Comamonas sp. C24C]